MGIEDLDDKQELANFTREVGTVQPARTLGRVPIYTVATRPTLGASERLVIAVSDGAAGAQFQGWNGSAWVNLG